MRRTQLISFLQSELAIPTNGIALARKQCERDPNLLLMILWQYGLITLSQLEQMFDWLETVGDFTLVVTTGWKLMAEAIERQY